MHNVPSVCIREPQEDKRACRGQLLAIGNSPLLSIFCSPSDRISIER